MTETETIELKKSLTELKEWRMSKSVILNKHGAGELWFAAARQGNVSNRRNPMRAELFRHLHMVDAWGRGVPMIMSNTHEVALREVEGLFIASFVRTSHLQPAPESDKPDSTVDKTGDKTPSTESEQALCAILNLDSQLTLKQLGARLGLTERGECDFTDKLQRQGVLQQEGANKTVAWSNLTYETPKGAA